jgi:hypothetical protein
MKQVGWISIFDKRPESESFVVVLYSSGRHTVAKFDGLFFTEDGLIVEGITHWLPLPKNPPQRPPLEPATIRN